ncbi:MAG: hypothetical protein PF961_16690 [Planctomycetota bacterium]|nr:hypothetical protein [Planctomycetota bacterium]
MAKATNRGRGAQSALIHARLHHAKRHGCRLALAETLGMLHTSLGNLQRAGFSQIQQRLVMRYGE